MVSVAIFNNKGGVGKTSLLCNLASYLSFEQNKKVIIIDADPQCNATSYIFSEPELEEIYTSTSKANKETILNIIKPLQKGKGYITTGLPIKQSINFGVDVIVGDPELSLIEDFLSKDWFDVRAGESRGLQTTLLFKDLLQKLSLSYDFVFFDMGPSLGSLNRSVLIASDTFIVPMSSDIFSLQALENISLSIKKWKEEINKGLIEYEKKEDEKFELNGNVVNCDINFAGYVTQQYTAKTVRGIKQPVNAYERIIRKIPNQVKKFLLPLNGDKSLISEKIGEIQNLSSLIPLSQDSHTPIFRLKKEHGVVGSHFNKVKDFKITLQNISEKFLENLNQLGV